MGELVKQGVGDEESDPAEVGEGTEAAAAAGGAGPGASKSADESESVVSKIDVFLVSGAGIDEITDQKLGGILVDGEIGGVVLGSDGSGTLERQGLSSVSNLVSISGSSAGVSPSVVGSLLAEQLAFTSSLGCARVVFRSSSGPDGTSLGISNGVESDISTVPVVGSGARGGNTDDDTVGLVIGGVSQTGELDEELDLVITILGPTDLVSVGSASLESGGGVGAHGGHQGGGKKQKCKHS